MLERIAELIEAQLAASASAGACRAIVAVGGFAQQPFLQRALTVEFLEDGGIPVVFPENPGVAVVEGAVIYGADGTKTDERTPALAPLVLASLSRLVVPSNPKPAASRCSPCGAGLHPEAIQVRCARKTYGVECARPGRPAMRRRGGCWRAAFLPCTSLPAAAHALTPGSACCSSRRWWRPFLDRRPPDAPAVAAGSRWLRRCDEENSRLTKFFNEEVRFSAAATKLLRRAREQ